MEGANENFVDRACAVAHSEPASNGIAPGIQFPLTTLFVVTGLLSVLFALMRLFGLTGALLAGDLVVLAIGIANLFRVRTMLGVRFPKVKVGEFGVLVILCFVLHGLAMPAVVTKCRPRGAAAGPAPVKGAAVGGASSTSEDLGEVGD